MSFDVLEQQIQHYNALASHTNSTLANRLSEVQAWQKQRMQALHAPLFAHPKNQLMARYFLERLYGGSDFPVLAKQFERVVHFAHRLEKLAPANAINTATLGISVAVLAVTLDEQLAAWLNTQIPTHQPITEALMIQAFAHTAQSEQRYQQLQMLEELGAGLDKYMRSFIIQSAFKLARGAAERKNFVPMYQFIEQGFAAMKPMTSTKDFIATFTSKEKIVVAQLLANTEHPFIVT